MNFETYLIPRTSDEELWICVAINHWEEKCKGDYE